MPFSFSTPEDLVLVEAALEDAWAMLVQRHGDPLASSGERERLAYIVAALWSEGVRDRVAEDAAAKFEATAPALSPTQVDPLA